MAVLEQEGYLVQPHTSAGRIPTDKGYRFFVDHLTTPGRLEDATRVQVGEFFAAAHGRLEEVLHRTTNLLARLTNHAAVVLGPNAEGEAVRSVQLVALSASAATVVVVFANGTVENQVIELTPDMSEARIAAATAHLAASLTGRTIASVDQLAPSGDALVDDLCRAAIEAVRTVTTDEHVYVGGTSSVAAAFDAVDVVRDVLRALEQQFVVVTLIRDIVDRGMSVAIGGEHGVEPLVACSVVVAPIVVEGERLGSIGVLGPTRMNYPQALATVGVVSDQLGRRLGDG
jgi:heat-inducible transcriptional repressor